MRIITKRIKVIQMTSEEHKAFLDTLQRAAEGHVSHYAESKLSDGSFLGVSVLTKEQEAELPKQAEERRIERDYAHNARQEYDRVTGGHKY